MKDVQDICIVEAEIYELLALIVTDQKPVSDVEVQSEIDLVLQAIKGSG